MNFSRVSAVVAKELLEIRKNRTLLFTIFLPPLLLTILPLGLLAILGSSTGGRTNLSPDEITRMQSIPDFVGLTASEVVQTLVLRQFLLLYLLLPLLIPVTIATYSIIGEKELRSLEPLLATPISTLELFVGKGIAAVVPAILATWFAYGVFFMGARFVVSDRVYSNLLNPMWLLAMLVLAPLLSLLAVSLGIIISSRVNDTRAAQQIAGLLVIPLVLLSVGQTAGFIFLNVVTFAVGALIVALIDVGVLYAGVQLFQRETILTRWK